MTTNVELRVATREDMDFFYPEYHGNTFVAVVGLVDGERVGIGGALWTGYLWYAFMEYDEDKLPSRRPLVRGARMAIELMQRMQVTLYAMPAEEEDHACAFLAHFGFRKNDRGVYVRRPV